MKEKSYNLVEVLGGITGRRGKGQPVDIMYLDFQKVFDKVQTLKYMGLWRAH